MDGADLTGSDLTNAGLTFARIEHAKLTGTTSRGFTKEQLYSTDSYWFRKSLHSIWLNDNDLSGWDLSGQDLSNANLNSTKLVDANLAGTNLKNTNLYDAELDAIGAKSTAVYNQWTGFPDGFDPLASDLVFEPSRAGDLTGDDLLDRADVSALSSAIRDGPREFWMNDAFDLNRDSVVDRSDLQVWIKDLKRSWYGDANLDGEFNSADLSFVSRSGSYERSGLYIDEWWSGDWNADSNFDSNDLVLAFQDGGYEQGPRIVANVVPEPSSFSVVLAGLIGVAVVSNSRRNGV